MLNQQSKSYIFFHYITDLALVSLSWFLATYIRFMILENDFRSFTHFIYLTPIPVIVAAYLLYRERFYTQQILHAWHREFSKLLMLNIKIQIFFVFAGYNLQSDRISRLTLILFFLINQILLIMNRVFFRNHLMKKMIKGELKQTVFLIGHGLHVDRLISKIKSNPQMAIEICCWADSSGQAEEMGIPSCRYEDIDNEVASLNPRSIMVGYSGRELGRQEKYIKTHYNQVTPIILIPQVNYALIGTTIEDVLGIPLIFINRPSMSSFSLLGKRLMDIGGSLFGLLILSPMLLIIATLVKITSPGPIFYGQERMTQDGRIFKMWKFRSMRQGADKEDGFTWTTENDPRKTKFGSFIRKTSLDEFPQLWNVLLGDMSLVGPRPERPELIEGFKDEIPGYMLRHKMRAGITGWAQINGWRGNTSLEKRIEFDMYYIRNWQLTLDLKILLLTVFNGFVNKNAY
jgi:exopolysaccharide biosynthesis polyprenyl glycosylphosphotransferase